MLVLRREELLPPLKIATPAKPFAQLFERVADVTPTELRAALRRKILAS